MGHANLDWDLATAARPQQVRRLFDRTIPVGIEFGTVGVLDAAGHMHEVTTFRRDVHHDGRHAVVEFGASLDEDLARRDFTINAIAFDPVENRLHDPFHGRDDLTAKVVRAVGNADARFVEDRLRALRAIRFAARFHFDIEPETWNAIVDSAPYLSRLSPERVKQEIEKTLDQVRRPSVAFSRWRDAGAFATVVPALAGVRDATLSAVDCLLALGTAAKPQRRILRLAALFSDCTGEVAERALRDLRFSNVDIAWTSALVAAWNREGPALIAAMQRQHTLSPEAQRRLVAGVGRLRIGPFVRLASAHWAVAEKISYDGRSSATVRQLHKQLLRSAFHDPVDVGSLVIDGDDLRRLGVPPGPVYGKVLAQLLDDILTDPGRNTVAWLEARVPAVLAALPASGNPARTSGRRRHE
jgi:tRNA nucleotidyltransferase (CCA-adding enzyme)